MIKMQENAAVKVFVAHLRIRDLHCIIQKYKLRTIQFGSSYHVLRISAESVWW